MAQCYANARNVLAQYGATLDNVVEEVLYVTDMDTAFAVAGAVRAEAYGGRPVVASTILVTPRLAFPSTVKMTRSFLSKAEFGAVPGPAEGDQRCDGCLQWEPPDSCKVVEGKISPRGWCALYAPRPK
jgi:hypothetical protein